MPSIPKRITSPQNPEFRLWMQRIRRGRMETGESLLPVEGPKLLAEARRSGWQTLMVAWPEDSAPPEALLDLPPASPQPVSSAFLAIQPPRVFVLPPALFERLGETRSPQAPFALVTPASQPDMFSSVARGIEFLRSHPRLLLADSIQDPGNLGTLIRSARAFAFDAILAVGECARPASAKVLRASAGALFHIPVLSVSDPSPLRAALSQSATPVFILEADGGESLSAVAWPASMALVVGNEAHGPESAWGALSVSRRIRIPMASGCESLNAAAAAAIAMYAVFVQLPPPLGDAPKPPVQSIPAKGFD